MAAALLSSFYLWYKQQRRRKSVRVPYRMRTASFSVVRFFSLLLSTAWVGLVGYREIPIRTLHLNVHTHTHTNTHTQIHTLTVWRHRRRCANLVLTHRRVIFFSFMLSVTSSRFIRPTSCSAYQREPCRSWCDCVVTGTSIYCGPTQVCDINSNDSIESRQSETKLFFWFKRCKTLKNKNK